MSLLTFFLAPNARYQLRDTTGQPAAFGKLYTYHAQTTDPKPTYSDPNGVNPNTNPVVFDAKGEANIYWEHDTDPDNNTLYYIEAYDADNNLIYTQDNYPTLENTNIPPSPDEGTEDNFVRNPQFTWWDNTTNFQNYTYAQDSNDFIIDDWIYTRTPASTATINISQGIFDLGQTVVPANPIYYLHYESNGGTGELFNGFQQYYKLVQTLSGQQISFSFWAKGSNGQTLTVAIIQQFGTGGSPSANVETFILTLNLTPIWQRFTASGIILPSIAGKTLGTNGDNSLILYLQMPINQSASVDMTNIQLQKLSTPTVFFPYETADEQFLKLDSQISQSVFKTGDFKSTLRNIADAGWVMCDDGTLGNSISGAIHALWATKALFTLIWNNISNTYAPIFNSDGTIGTRGSTPELDYFSNKRLALTKTVGRILATSGQAQLSQTFTVDTSTDLLTIADTSSFYSGTPVTLTTTGTLPSPLAPATTYYVFNISATTLYLCTSAVNVVAESFINITTTGTGIHTLSINYATWIPGQYIGENQHLLIKNEMPAHTHDYVTFTTTPEGQGGGTDFDIGEGSQTSTVAGGSVTHNITNPTTFIYTMIKL